MPDRALERDTYIENREHNPIAEAKSVVIKGFDGSNYPALKTNADGTLATSEYPYYFASKEADGGYTYVMSYSPTEWQILRINETTGLGDYATGTTDKSTAWTGRASHTYITY